MLNALEARKSEFELKWESPHARVSRELAEIQTAQSEERLQRNLQMEYMANQVQVIQAQNQLQSQLLRQLLSPGLLQNPGYIEPQPFFPAGPTAALPMPSTPLPSFFQVSPESAPAAPGASPTVVEEIEESEEVDSPPTRPADFSCYQVASSRPTSTTVAEAVSHIFHGTSGMAPFLQLWMKVDRRILFGSVVKVRGNETTSIADGKTYVRNRKSKRARVVPRCEDSR